MSQSQLDDIPIYIPNHKGIPIIHSWLPRSSISFYNVHVNLDQGVFRVGEQDVISNNDPKTIKRVYIFDRCGFQWGEHQQIPAVLSR